MNMQAIMRQAQSMQKEMLKIKNEIDNMEFVGESSFVSVTVNGKKQIVDVKINQKVEADDIDILPDLFVVATNNALKQVDDVTERKMSKFGNVPGLF